MKTSLENFDLAYKYTLKSIRSNDSHAHETIESLHHNHQHLRPLQASMHKLREDAANNAKMASKKLISLSEILSSEKTSQFNSLSTTTNTASATATTTATTTFLKPVYATLAAESLSNSAIRFNKYQASVTSSPTLSSPSSMHDLLTVQELFEELQLDCDDQIKQLDTFERQRKADALKQKKILDDIRLKCQNYPHLFKVAASRENSSLRRKSREDVHGKLLGTSSNKDYPVCVSLVDTYRLLF